MLHGRTSPARSSEAKAFSRTSAVGDANRRGGRDHCNQTEPSSARRTRTISRNWRLTRLRNGEVPFFLRTETDSRKTPSGAGEIHRNSSSPMRTRDLV